jgi:hypothetical protein
VALAARAAAAAAAVVTVLHSYVRHGLLRKGVDGLQRDAVPKRNSHRTGLFPNGIVTGWVCSQNGTRR